MEESSRKNVCSPVDSIYKIRGTIKEQNSKLIEEEKCVYANVNLSIL